MELGREITIVCDSCKHEFSSKALEVQEIPYELNGKTVTVLGFQCPSCNHMYVFAILDYHAKKLQDKYLNKVESIRKRQNAHGRVSPAAIQDAEQLKQEAMAYQNKLLLTYRESQPEDTR